MGQPNSNPLSLLQEASNKGLLISCTHNKHQQCTALQQCQIHDFSLVGRELSCTCGHHYKLHHVVSVAHSHIKNEGRPQTILYMLATHDGSYGLLNNDVYCGDDNITAFMTDLYLSTRR